MNEANIYHKLYNLFKKNGWYSYRIENIQTTTGIPDILYINNKKGYGFIELKICNNKNMNLKFMPGQKVFFDRVKYNVYILVYSNYTKMYYLFNELFENILYEDLNLKSTWYSKTLNSSLLKKLN